MFRLYHVFKRHVIAPTDSPLEYFSKVKASELADYSSAFISSVAARLAKSGRMRLLWRSYSETNDMRCVCIERSGYRRAQREGAKLRPQLPISSRCLSH